MNTGEKDGLVTISDCGTVLTELPLLLLLLLWWFASSFGMLRAEEFSWTLESPLAAVAAVEVEDIVVDLSTLPN